MTIATIRDLADLLSDSRYIGKAGGARRGIKGFSTDSRSLKKGEAFFALVGENFDGHAFIDAVAANGASVAVVSEGWFERQKELHDLMPVIVVPDTLAAYGQVAAAHRSGFDIPVIAVAGSNGKTTTKELIADLLATKHTVLRTEGNLNNLIGVPAMLLRMTPEHTAAVIEIGTNMPGEIAALCRILRPTHGIITNIGREHLELLGSIEGVAREEGALFEYLAETGGMAFVNLDDPHLAAMEKSLPKKLTYGRGKRAEILGKKGKLNQFGAPALEIVDGRKGAAKGFSLQLQTPGEHTAQNALAASAVALAMRIAPRDIKRVLESFEPPVYKGGYARLAPMVASNGAVVLNDTYNANPDSTIVALETLASLKPKQGGRRIAVLADMKELGSCSADEHAKIGRAIATMAKIDLAIFHGDEMRRAYESLAAEGKGAQRFFFADKSKLADWLASMLAPADVLLVKGSRGMKMEDVVGRVVRKNDEI